MMSSFNAIRLVCLVCALAGLTAAVTLDILLTAESASGPDHALLYIYTFDPTNPPSPAQSRDENVSSIMQLHALSDDEIFTTPPSSYRGGNDWLINYSSNNAQQFISFNTATHLVTVDSPMPMLHIPPPEYSDITVTYDHIIFMQQQQTQYAISAPEFGSNTLNAVFLQIYINATTPVYNSFDIPMNPPAVYNQTLTSFNGANQVMLYSTLATDQQKMLIFIPIIDVVAMINTIYIYDVSQPYNIRALPPFNYTLYYGAFNVLMSVQQSYKLNKLLAANYIMTSKPGPQEEFKLQITAIDLNTGNITVLIDSIPMPLSSFVCSHAYDDITGNWYCVCYGGHESDITFWSVYANVYTGKTSQPVTLNIDDIMLGISLNTSNNDTATTATQ
ncbi:unnamed protein product [Sphagnum balticum]